MIGGDTPRHVRDGTTSFTALQFEERPRFARRPNGDKALFVTQSDQRGVRRFFVGIITRFVARQQDGRVTGHHDGLFVTDQMGRRGGPLFATNGGRDVFVFHRRIGGQNVHTVRGPTQASKQGLRTERHALTPLSKNTVLGVNAFFQAPIAVRAPETDGRIVAGRGQVGSDGVKTHPLDGTLVCLAAQTLVG